jgi:Tfp pilus assembly protein FimT
MRQKNYFTTGPSKPIGPKKNKKVNLNGIQKNTGFSLIEFLIILAILVILYAMINP